MPVDGENVHAGHRKRMRERYRMMGLDNFAPHEALELLLYNTIPLRDVNPIAHALIDRFGTLNAVLLATEEELVKTPGIGPKSARFLVTVGQACELYASYCDNRLDISKFSSIIEYMNQLFVGDDCEETWVVCMDKSGRLLGAGIVSTSGWHIKDIVRNTLKIVIRNRASTIVVVDRRKHENISATHQDIQLCMKISKSMLNLGVLAIDMILASKGEFLSMRRKKLFDPIHSLKEADDNLAKMYLHWLD